MVDLLKKVTLEAESADKGWGVGYHLFSNILNKYDLKTGVEIGVTFGGHSEAILSLTKIEKLYGVDPYKNFDDYDDPMNLPQSEFDVLYEFTKNRLASFGKRFEIIRDVSSSAVTRVSSTVDFVYIDALHTYEGVRDDLINWFPKVRAGGVIGGHDYDHPNFPGVKKAIDEFFSRFDWEIHVEGHGVWWVEKKTLSINFFIPAFNCERTLEESILSIINGNLSEGDEIVIVNDCSTDNTSDIIAKLQDKYSYIKCINHNRNKGGAAARNTAIENCKNELLFCLDSDNVLEKNSISRLKEHLINNNADVASFQKLYYFTGNIQNITHEWVFHRNEYTLADCLSTIKFPGASGNYMFTKKSWEKSGGYPEFAGALDAWGLGFRQVATGSKMVVLPNSYYFHRHGHDSYWVRESKRGKVSLSALQIVIPFIDLFKNSDVQYITSEKGRHSWFENVDNHPIRLKNEKMPSLAYIKYLASFEFLKINKKL